MPVPSGQAFCGLEVDGWSTGTAATLNAAQQPDGFPMKIRAYRGVDGSRA